MQELSKPFDMSGPAITKHLNVLEKAGLISRSKEAQWRPCKLEPDSLKKASDWLNEYKEFWEASLNRLEDYLKTINTKTVKKKKGAKDGRKK